MSTVESRPPAARRGVDPVGSPLARWASLIVLAIAAVILAYGLVLAVGYMVMHSSPPCTNPPQRSSNPPQLVAVGLCLLLFVVGHVTARWQEINRVHLGRHRAPDAPPERDPRKKEGLIIQGLLLVFLVEVLGLLVIEISTLSRSVWPITYYVRCSYDAAGWPATLTAAAILFLIGRWFWLPRGGRDAPTRT